MRVVVQRVLKASVMVDQTTINQIDQGLVLLVGLNRDDTIEEIKYMAEKISKLRIFSDQMGLMNLNINQVDGQILSISQFTLYGDVKKQNRPGFSKAMAFDKAKDMYKLFNNQLIDLGLRVKEGIFGEEMKISLINDGPVTIIIDKDH